MSAYINKDPMERRPSILPRTQVSADRATALECSHLPVMPQIGEGEKAESGAGRAF